MEITSNSDLLTAPSDIVIVVDIMKKCIDLVCDNKQVHMYYK